MIGGGNTAVEEALFLTNFASKVTLVHRRDSLRAEKILQDRLFQPPQDRGDLEPRARRGAGRGRRRAGVTGVRLRDVAPGPSGRCPARACSSRSATRRRRRWSRGSCALHNGGYVVTKPDSTATDIPGVFAAGDITDHVFRQAVTSAGMGCMAALEAERFLAAEDADEPVEATAIAAQW